MEYKYDVFISYSRRDYVDEEGKVLPNSPVKKIRKAFDKQGITYWFDEKGIYSGGKFIEIITQAIEDSKKLVFIASENSNASEWTGREIKEAIDQKKTIIPVRIDNSRYSRKFRLILNDLDFIDYQRNPEKALERLVSSVKAEIIETGGGGGTLSPPPPPQEPPIWKRRKFIMSIVCSVMVFIGILIYRERIKPLGDHPDQTVEKADSGTGGSEIPTPSKQEEKKVFPEPVKPKLVAVTGTISDATNGGGLSDAVVKSSDGSKVTTDLQGKYSFTGGVESGSMLSVVYGGKEWETRRVTKAGSYDFLLPLPEKTSVQNSARSDSQHSPSSTPVTASATETVNGRTLRWDSGVTDSQKSVLRALVNNMVDVAGGTFSMGSDDSEAYSDEKPVHRESVGSFSINRYEVTQKEWVAVMGTNPSRFKGDNLPVEQVSWNDCQTFIRKLNALTGLPFRLPTEAEWEYAAKGGNRSQNYKYSGSNSIGGVAWYGDNSGNRTHPVGTKSANELGLYDMSGNVWEWTASLWCSDYNSARTGSNRVDRGGCWGNIARYCRSSCRYCDTPDYRFYYLGLRLVL